MSHLTNLFLFYPLEKHLDKVLSPSNKEKVGVDKHFDEPVMDDLSSDEDKQQIVQIVIPVPSPTLTLIEQEIMSKNRKRGLRAELEESFDSPLDNSSGAIEYSPLD